MKYHLIDHGYCLELGPEHQAYGKKLLRNMKHYSRIRKKPVIKRLDLKSFDQINNVLKKKRDYIFYPKNNNLAYTFFSWVSLSFLSGAGLNKLLKRPRGFSEGIIIGFSSLLLYITFGFIKESIAKKYQNVKIVPDQGFNSNELRKRFDWEQISDLVPYISYKPLLEDLAQNGSDPLIKVCKKYMALSH
jgi:hypothetical protein